MSLNEELFEEIIENFLINVTSANGTSECAAEAQRLLNDKKSASFIVYSITLSEELPNKPEHEVMLFSAAIFSAIASTFQSHKANKTPEEFEKLYGMSNEDAFKSCMDNMKLHLAVRSFVSTYLFADDFSKKYPEIFKSL